LNIIIKNKIIDITENEECDEVELGSICEFNYGTRITKRDNIIGNIPVYGGGDITFYTNKSNRKSNTLILSRYAMSKKCIRIINNDFYLNDSGLSIDSININQNYINYIMIDDYYQNYIYYNCSVGSIQRNINMNLLKQIKIKIPKDKLLITALEPLFNEVEELEKSIENDEKLFKEYLEELAKDAIISYDTPQTTNINNYEIDEIDEKQSTIGEKELTQMTIQELKNKCKELNIKGYSKMKKEELIDIINKE
jgi:hypothetical protein